MKHMITRYPQSSGPLAVRIVDWARDTRDGGTSTSVPRGSDVPKDCV